MKNQKNIGLKGINVNNFRNEIKELIKIIEQSPTSDNLKDPESRKSTIKTMYSLRLYCLHKQMFTELCEKALRNGITVLEDPLLNSLFNQIYMEFSPPHNERIIIRFIIPHALKFFDDIYTSPDITQLLNIMFDNIASVKYEWEIKLDYEGSIKLVESGSRIN